MTMGEKIAAARKAAGLPEYSNAAWLLRYQMITLAETFKRLLCQKRIIPRQAASQNL